MLPSAHAWRGCSAACRRHGAAAASAPPRSRRLAAAASGGHAGWQQQQQQPDPGLEAFKALIAERRFTCTQCGKCCTGDGEVWITDGEAANIAAHLNMPLNRFLATHTRGYSKVAGFRLLRANTESPARECTFLRPDNTCAIHVVRPMQCSTYPWWPDLMNDKDWAWEKEHICEGFDHPDAPPTDLDDAARQLRLATALEYQKMLATKPSKKQQAAAAAAAIAAAARAPEASSSDAAPSAAAGAKAAAWQQRLQQLQQLVDGEE